MQCHEPGIEVVRIDVMSATSQCNLDLNRLDIHGDASAGTGTHAYAYADK